jgi:hypothetical protein
MSAIAATTDHLRDADLPTLAATLNDQRVRSVDVVAPAHSITARGGAIVVQGVAPLTEISEDGVTATDVDGIYVPTRVADEGVSAKLNIPLAYLQRSRDVDLLDGPHGSSLYDVNVNAWLGRQKPGTKFLLRLLKNRDGDPSADGFDGVVRALLSNSFRCIDNFDVLLASLRGIADAGVTDPIITADLTDRRMVVRVAVPQIAVLAPKLLEGYRSPFGGHDAGVLLRDGRDGALAGWTPERVARASAGEGQQIEGGGQTVFAGFVISNSDTGGSAFNITPRLVVRVCNNGLTITAEAIKRVHLGAKLDEGTIQWSEVTARKNLDLVASQTGDAVRQFVNVDYVAEKVAQLEADAATPIDDAPAVIASVSKRLGFSEAEQANILGHFIKGGQLTAGGVMQAVTSAAQLHADGDAAWDMECRGVDAMHAAVAAMRTPAKA